MLQFKIRQMKYTEAKLKLKAMCLGLFTFCLQHYNMTGYQHAAQ